MRAIKLFLSYVVVLFFPIQSLYALEQTTFFKKFSGLCVNSIHDLELIKNFSKIENWPTLPENMIPNVAPIDYDNFDGWYFKEGDVAFIIGISDFTENEITKHTCSLATNKAKYEINEKLLIELYEVELIDELKQGIQTSKVFITNHPFLDEVFISTIIDNRKKEFNLSSFAIVASIPQ